MPINHVEEQATKNTETIKSNRKKTTGLHFDRNFTKVDEHPYSNIEWDIRTASITNDKGVSIFEQKDVEVPKSWSQMAVDVVVSKYFHGEIGTPERETSIKQLIDRVATTLKAWGIKDKYFATEQDADIFEDELTYILVNQLAAFNSPVWFNLGVEENPQCSACFINSIEDTMDGILDLVKTEGRLFKHGSGTGTNFSSLRSSVENVRGGGVASGPVSFMKGYDAFAGVIKSGGKTRRAAKMVILNADHPDIEEFILCKALEEKKAWALIDQGYDGSFNGEAYNSVFFQNSNNSVRATNAFMKAVVNNKPWHTRAVTSGKVLDTYSAKSIMKKIAEATHICGDPGMQFDTAINDWHTCKATSRIDASNPCSEYMFVDNSSCNLSSINLMKFLKEDNSFAVNEFSHTTNIMITAMDIIVDNGSYPTTEITDNSHIYRPLGLGYANLGAVLMAKGFPYDSDEGRAYAAAITALITGQAYKQSAIMAKSLSPFEKFEPNKDSMLQVIQMHRFHLSKIESSYLSNELLNAVNKVWKDTNVLGAEYGFRNAQVSVLAPTGTIGFFMDCDTTGIEPDIALVKYKKLVGGGMLKLVNNTVSKALTNLGYSDKENEDILTFIEKNDTIEGAPHLKTDDLCVFDCAFKPLNGTRFIHHMGHLRMMAAVQPFLSGAISKTVNIPTETTVDEIMNIYIEAWQMGIKAVAIYRDSSKRIQPLSTSNKKATNNKKESGTEPSGRKPYRRHLPNERPSITHKFSIAGHEGYLTVGMYEDNNPGEIFVRMAKEGSVVSGLVDAFATATSIMLQYGVPLEILVNKFSHTRFEPSGFTTNKDIPIAKSILDYIFRWLSLKFIQHKGQEALRKAREAVSVDTITIEKKTDKVLKEKVKETLKKSDPKAKADLDIKATFTVETDAPPCPTCGNIMVRNGACHKCTVCGATDGCS